MIRFDSSWFQSTISGNMLALRFFTIGYAYDSEESIGSLLPLCENNLQYFLLSSMMIHYVVHFWGQETYFYFNVMMAWFFWKSLEECRYAYSLLLDFDLLFLSFLAAFSSFHDTRLFWLIIFLYLLFFSGLLEFVMDVGPFPGSYFTISNPLWQLFLYFYLQSILPFLRLSSSLISLLNSCVVNI